MFACYLFSQVSERPVPEQRLSKVNDVMPGRFATCHGMGCLRGRQTRQETVPRFHVLFMEQSHVLPESFKTWSIMVKLDDWLSCVQRHVFTVDPIKRAMPMLCKPVKPEGFAKYIFVT